MFTSQLLASPFYYLSLKYNSVLLTEIIIRSAPVFIVLLSVFFFGQRLIYKKIAGILITLSGVAAVIFALKSREAPGMITMVGIILALISSFSYGMTDIIRKKTRAFINALTVLFWGYLLWVAPQQYF